MAEKLKTLEEHNSQALECHTKMNDTSPRKNGIACPKCGEEMYDSYPYMILPSFPPQHYIHCDCGHIRY